MKAADNLRGLDVLVEFDGTPRLVNVVTHIRGDKWLVEGRALPTRFRRRMARGLRRTVVTRAAMTLVAQPDK